MALRRLTALLVAVLFGVLLLAASPAHAVDDPDYTSPPPTTVVTTTVVREVRQVPTVVKTTELRSRLAITGSDMSQLAAVGVVLVLAGAGVLVLRHRRTTLA